MAFDVKVQWTADGFAARQQKANTLPLPDRAAYSLSLNDAIRAWAMMQLSSVNPGPTSDGYGFVSYASATAPTPKQLQTFWDCDIRNWTPVGLIAQVTGVQ